MKTPNFPVLDPKLKALQKVAGRAVEIKAPKRPLDGGAGAIRLSPVQIKRALLMVENIMVML